MRLIDADALLEELKVCDFVVSSIIGDGDTLLFEDDVIKRIKGMPTAEKVGKWMRTDSTSGWEKNYYCSECRCEFFVETCMLRPMWNYCPNCGARMDEVTE